MQSTTDTLLLEVVREAAHPLTGTARDYDPLMDLVGCTTYHGTVTAASDWGEPAERKRVRPALASSYEALFHAPELACFLLTWREGDTMTKACATASLSGPSGSFTVPEPSV